MVVFYTIKWPKSWHWTSSRNMFTYFHSWKFFWIIFTVINFFNQRFKTYLNHTWCFIWLRILVKILIYFFPVLPKQLHKDLYFYILFHDIRFYFLFTFVIMFWGYSSVTKTVFLLQDNASFIHQGSLKE